MISKSIIVMTSSFVFGLLYPGISIIGNLTFVDATALDALRVATCLDQPVFKHIIDDADVDYEYDAQDVSSLHHDNMMLNKVVLGADNGVCDIAMDNNGLAVIMAYHPTSKYVGQDKCVYEMCIAEEEDESGEAIDTEQCHHVTIAIHVEDCSSSPPTIIIKESKKELVVTDGVQQYTNRSSTGMANTNNKIVVENLRPTLQTSDRISKAIKPKRGLLQPKTQACLTKQQCKDKYNSLNYSGHFYANKKFKTKGCFTKNNGKENIYFGIGGSTEEMSTSTLTGTLSRVWCDKTLPPLPHHPLEELIAEEATVQEVKQPVGGSFYPLISEPLVATTTTSHPTSKPVTQMKWGMITPPSPPSITSWNIVKPLQAPASESPVSYPPTSQTPTKKPVDIISSPTPPSSTIWNIRPTLAVQSPTGKGTSSKAPSPNDIASPTPPTITWNIDRPEEGKGQTPPSKAPSPQEEWHFFSPNSSPAAVSHATELNDTDTSNEAGDTVSDFGDYLWNYNADKMEIHPCDDDGKSSSRSRGRVCTHDVFIFGV